MAADNDTDTAIPEPPADQPAAAVTDQATELAPEPTAEELAEAEAATERRITLSIEGVIGLIVGAIVIAIIIFVVLITGAQHYTNLKSTTVGTASGQKMTVSYPAKMTAISTSAEGAIYADFSSKGNQKLVAAEVEADGQAVGDLPTSAVDSFKSILKNKLTGYDETIQAFTSQPSSDSDKLTFGAFTDFRTATISNGLQADFTYNSKSTGKPGHGRLIFAFGKTKLYVLTMLAEQKKWDANASAWTKIAGSLAIDQN